VIFSLLLSQFFIPKVAYNSSKIGDLEASISISRSLLIKYLSLAQALIPPASNHIVHCTRKLSFDTSKVFGDIFTLNIISRSSSVAS